MPIKKIIKNYTPNSKTLLTPESQAKVIQDMYDQVREFYSYFSSAEFIQTVKGEKGAPGAEGARGEKGLKGDKGEQGVIGPVGPRGPKGDTGATGLPGPKGDKGDTGAQGVPGAIGPRGPQGLDGIPGRKGDKGDQGSTGVPFGILGVFDTYQELVTEAQREDAKFYLVASLNDQNGDLYVYRAKYDDFIFLNNVIYDLAFQIISGPPGRNYLTFTKGEHIDEYGNIQIDETETMDEYGYLHTNVVLNYLKGNGVKKTEWTQDDRDSQWSQLVITFDNGTTATIKVKNGKGIDKTEKTGTNVLVDSYRITYSDGTHFDYTVTNGKGINKIEKTSTDVLTDIYTIYWNDNSTTTYSVVNGRGVTKIEKTSTNVLVDTYTITYNDNTTSTFTVTNGKGISSIALTSTNVLVDTYTITFNDGSTQSYTVTNGRGIVSITKTSSSGVIDTYTILYNDTSTSTFTVVNGKSAYQLAVDKGYQGTLEEYLQIIAEIYIGAGSTYTDVFIAADKHEAVKSPSRFNITANNNKIIIIYPNTNTYIGTPQINGIDIPIISSTFTDNDIVYNVLTSVNNYNGNLTITI